MPNDRDPRHPRRATGANRTTTEPEQKARSANSSADSQRTRIEYVCEYCGAEADATRLPGSSKFCIGSHSDKCPGGSECLVGQADLAGAPGAYALLEDAPRWLGHLARVVPPAGPPAALPDADMVSGWHARLLGSEGTGALRYLREERGLSLDTIECDAIGFDGVAITLLVNNKDGYLVNLRRRFYPTREPKIVGLAGRGSHLFPEVPEPGTSVLLVAGEFDALLAEQEGLPAVSTTTGASLPDHLVSHFSRCRVAVAYDVGEEAAAARTVEKLRRVVAEAWVVPLPMPNHGDDLTDWFVRDHRTARELLACIRRARRAVS